MSEIFLEFIGDASPWLLPLLILLAVWGKLNWAALNNPDKKQSFDRAVSWLKEDSFGQLYLRFLGRVMDRLGDWIGDRQQLSQGSMTGALSNSFTQKVFGFNPFTSKSYEKCLWLAFIYPVFAYLLAWMMGAEGQVGEASLFGNEFIQLSVWQRWALFGGTLLFILAGLWLLLRLQGWKQWFVLGLLLLVPSIVVWLGGGGNDFFLFLLGSFLFLFVPIYLAGWLVSLVRYRSSQVAHQKIYSFAFAFSYAVALTLTFALSLSMSMSQFSESILIALPVALIVARTFAFAGAFTFASVGAFAFAFSYAFFAGTLAVTGVLIVFLKILRRLSKRRGDTHWLWLIYSTFLIIAAFTSLAVKANSEYTILVLLWLLLPVVNASLDWLSLGFTRGLLQAVRTGNHSSWRTMTWAGVDLLLAFVFLFLITAVLVGVVTLGNALAGKTLVDIGCILSKIKGDAAHADHWWIYFMLLSTLIPTLIHFALAGGAATLWLPRKWRMQLADGLKDDMHKTFGAWVYLTFTPVVGFILLPLALLSSLWLLLNTNSGALGKLLLSWAEGLGKWADPSMLLVCGAVG